LGDSSGAKTPLTKIFSGASGAQLFRYRCRMHALPEKISSFGGWPAPLQS
jgi:hypothetical protein